MEDLEPPAIDMGGADAGAADIVEVPDMELTGTDTQDVVQVADEASDTPEPTEFAPPSFDIAPNSDDLNTAEISETQPPSAASDEDPNPGTGLLQPESAELTPEWLAAQRAELEAEAQSDAAQLSEKFIRPESVAETPVYDQHVVPATVYEELDTFNDERLAEDNAARHPTHKPLDELPDANLRGATYEAMVQREVTEGPADGEKIRDHPAGHVLMDGRPIAPDFDVVKNGQVTELIDAKGYNRKDVTWPDAAAASITHMSDLEHTSRYTQVDEPSVEKVTIYAPAETANLPAVQEAVASLGTEERPVELKAAGTEAGLAQRMTDLRTDASERFLIPDEVDAELERIQSLPVEERREAMGAYVQTLQDARGNEATESRNLRWETGVERNGDGVTVHYPDGRTRTVWYVERSG